MGILKDLSAQDDGQRGRSYTDQRSDGDTERYSSSVRRRLLPTVTQTNDPMGILKESSTSCLRAARACYTDQRSDGDTESSFFRMTNGREP